MTGFAAQPGAAWVGHFQPGLAGATAPVPAFTPILVNTWTGSYARNPLAYKAGPPPITPLAVPVGNTAGNWLFVLASWRQDAGTAGTLQYPSTVAVSDDAGNFWIPVETGLPASQASSSPGSGIVRCAAWMAPAARACEYVFVSPTGYQSSLTVLVAEFTGASRFYQVKAQAAAYANQGTSVTLSQTIPAGVFALGVTAWDNTSGSVTVSALGWTALADVVASNDSNHAGDLRQDSWYATGTAAILSLTTSGSPTMDLAEVIIAVSGVADARACPYSLENQAENWPVLVTELGAGEVLNSNSLLSGSVSPWTATGGSIASVSWPAFTPEPSYGTASSGSALFTPSGSATQGGIVSEKVSVSQGTAYTVTAQVWSPGGLTGSAPDGSGGLAWGGTTTGAYLGITWYDSGGTSLSEVYSAYTGLPPGTWTQISFAAPVFPPYGAAYAAASVLEYLGGQNVPAAALLYTGYAALSVARSYEGTPPDQVTWTDVSTRNYTQGTLEISRGIQYEQQTLEAGEMTVFLRNYDAALTFGNLSSPFWPAAGDTDIPVRLRAVWPGSLTPYYPLFSGFTDDVKFGWDTQEETWYAYAEVTASDSWSRLTQQMLACAFEEVLQDSPVAFVPASISGASLAPGAVTSAVPWTALQGNGGATSTFSGSAISLSGAQGISCWEVSGVPAGGYEGIALGYFPQQGAPDAMPAISGGVTVEFWFQPVSASASQPTQWLTVCTCWAQDRPAWSLTINNTAGAASSTMSVTVYDKSTGSATTTALTGSPEFLQTTPAGENWFIAVTFTQTSLTVAQWNQDSTVNTTTVSCNLPAGSAGLSFAGNAGPVFSNNNGSTPGMMNMAVYGFAVLAEIVPAARLAAHYTGAFSAFATESDCWRLARIAGYSGFTPVLGMRGLDLAAAPAADVDVITGATDTNTQVVSAYFGNVAASTLAAMFVDGAGTLIYRRRAEWYGRAIGQQVFGELDSQSLSLGINALNTAASVTGWAGQNGATLNSSSQSAAGTLFYPHCAVFTGDGATADPQAAFGAATGGTGPAVTPGEWYALSAWVYSAQGWAGGAALQIQFWDGATLKATETFALPALAAGDVAFMAVTGRAPATATQAGGFIRAIGTPPATTGFYLAEALLSQVNLDYAAGAQTAVAEVPYLPDVRLSADRAQLYNYFVGMQYGTTLVSSFTGTDVTFTPSSGVIVLIVNDASVALRGQVPYTATLLLSNTVQALPYYLDEGSMEDAGSWITQTLGSPVLRLSRLALTPAATPSALIPALVTEVGDTATFRRRQPGVPQTQLLAYASKLSHSADISNGQWDTAYELSPFATGTVLACDDVIRGVLTGGNRLGW